MHALHATMMHTDETVSYSETFTYTAHRKSLLVFQNYKSLENYKKTSNLIDSFRFRRSSFDKPPVGVGGVLPALGVVGLLTASNWCVYSFKVALVKSANDLIPCVCVYACVHVLV